MDLHHLEDPFLQAALGARLQEHRFVASGTVKGRIAAAFPSLRRQALVRSYKRACRAFDRQPTQEGLLALGTQYGRLLYWETKSYRGVTGSWNTPDLVDLWADIVSLVLERSISGEFADLLGEWEDDAPHAPFVEPE